MSGPLIHVPVAGAVFNSSNHDKFHITLYIQKDEDDISISALKIGTAFELLVLADIWKYLPSTVSSIAPYLLPHSINLFNTSSSAHHIPTELGKKGSQSRYCTVPFDLNLLQAVNKSRITNFLNKLNGNPRMLFEVKDERFKFAFVTEAKLLNCSAEDNTSNFVLTNPGSLENFEKVRINSNLFYRIFRLLRWIVLGFLFTAVCWVMLYDKSTLILKIPAIWNHRTVQTLKDVMLNLPHLRLEAWDLGKLYNKLKTLEDSVQSSKAEIDQVLNNTARILKRTSLSSEQFHSLKEMLLENEKDQGIVSRVMGFFSFVHLLWILGIMGISISLGPVIKLVLKLIAEALMTMIKFVTEKIIIPTAIFMHRNGLFQLLAWIFLQILYVE